MSSSRRRKLHDRRCPRCRPWPSSQLLNRREPDLGSRSIFCTNPANCSNPNAWHISVRRELHSPGGAQGGKGPPLLKNNRGNMSKTTHYTLPLVESKAWGGGRCLCSCCRKNAPCDSVRPSKRDAQGLPLFPVAQLSFQGKVGYKQGAGNQPRFTSAHRAHPHIQRNVQLQRCSLLFPL